MQYGKWKPMFAQRKFFTPLPPKHDMHLKELIMTTGLLHSSMLCIVYDVPVMLAKDYMALQICANRTPVAN